MGTPEQFDQGVEVGPFGYGGSPVAEQGSRLRGSALISRGCKNLLDRRWDWIRLGGLGIGDRQPEPAQVVVLVVVAIPAQTLRENLKSWRRYLPPSLPIVSTLKGIEATSNARMTEIISAELEIPLDNVGLLTGPNLAAELIIRQPAGAVAASPSRPMQELMIDLFTTEYFRVYPSSDLVGCELAGATKSIIALAVGMAIGLGYGENTQAMIITRGLGEVARFGAGYGANPLTNLGLAGMGDLIASCGSPLSRNRTFGEVLGRTGSIEAARLEAGKTVEAVASAPAILELAHQVGVVVPIIEVVSDVVQNGLTPSEGMKRLMTISLAAELQ